MNQLPVPENSLRRYDVTSVTSYLIGLVIEQSNYRYQSAMIGFYQRVIKITRQVEWAINEGNTESFISRLD